MILLCSADLAPNGRPAVPKAVLNPVLKGTTTSYSGPVYLRLSGSPATLCAGAASAGFFPWWPTPASAGAPPPGWP